METISLKRLLFYSIMSIIAVMGLAGWMANLIIPDWEVYIEQPFWHSFHGWLLFGIICGLTVVILYFLVDLAIDKQVLEKENKELKEKIALFEAEKERIEAK